MLNLDYSAIKVKWAGKLCSNFNPCCSFFPKYMLDRSDYFKHFHLFVQEFLLLNQGTAPPFVVWDTVKAYIRGISQSFISQISKVDSEEEKVLRGQLNSLIQIHMLQISVCSAATQVTHLQITGL